MTDAPYRHIPPGLADEAYALWFRRLKPDEEGAPEYLIRCAFEVVDQWLDTYLEET